MKSPAKYMTQCTKGRLTLANPTTKSPQQFSPVPAGSKVDTRPLQPKQPELPQTTFLSGEEKRLVVARIIDRLKGNN